MGFDTMPQKQRRTVASIGGLRMHALHDTNVVSAPGRLAAASKLDARLLADVDPDGTLPLDERARRLARARSAYFKGLAFRSAKSRTKGKAAPIE